MKKMNMLIIAGILTASIPACNPSGSETEKTDTTSASADHVKPVYAYPVKYTEWEIGNPEYIKIVIDCYKSLDENDTAKIPGYFSDTVFLRLPNENKELRVANNKINDLLMQNRSFFASSSNNILSAISLHDRESNEDWVMITTYNKWVEKSGARDSVLLHEDWIIKDGKLKMLMSYAKTPTKTFLERNDSTTKK